MKFTKRFYKLNNRWYIDIPEYYELGYCFEDLEMVDGADLMLDEISNNKDSIILTFSDEILDDFKLILSKVEEDNYGAIYLYNDNKAWLCNVTKHFFNEFPNKIYIKWK